MSWKLVVSTNHSKTMVQTRTVYNNLKYTKNYELKSKKNYKTSSRPSVEQEL